MTDVQVFETRAPAPRPNQRKAELSERMAEANTIARAGREVLPAAYVDNPGACLLAVDLAAKLDIDLLSVFQNVSFIRGKPMIQAELRVELASRLGYKVKTDHIDEKSCTVTLLDAAGAEVGDWTSTIDADGDMSKDTWKKYPRQMLFANATRNLCKFYAHGLPATIQGEPDDPNPDVIDEIVQPEDVSQEPAIPVEDHSQEPEIEVDLAADFASEGDIKAALRANNVRQGDAIRAVTNDSGITEGDLGSIKGIAASPEATAWLTNWIKTGQGNG